MKRLVFESLISFDFRIKLVNPGFVHGHKTRQNSDQLRTFRDSPLKCRRVFPVRHLKFPVLNTQNVWTLSYEIPVTSAMCLVITLRSANTISSTFLRYPQWEDVYGRPTACLSSVDVLPSLKSLAQWNMKDDVSTKSLHLLQQFFFSNSRQV